MITVNIDVIDTGTGAFDSFAADIKEFDGISVRTALAARLEEGRDPEDETPIVFDELFWYTKIEGQSKSAVITVSHIDQYLDKVLMTGIVTVISKRAK